ncbi:MAG: GDSL-type esterase/lipase family protein [Clostridiales bacterium]|nr:GDSL-type esterase/lipase family protein [Clostridiales bacterium]
MFWNTSWSYLPVNYGTNIGTIENMTQRSILWNNVSGNKVKVRFSNRYGKTPLLIEKAVIAQLKEGNETVSESVVLTYENCQQITIEPGKEFYSDEIEYTISAGSRFVLSLYVKEKTEIASACSTWSAKEFQTVYALDGDHTMDVEIVGKESREVFPYVEADVNKATILFGVSEILVQSEQKVTTICLFGDSITHMSYYHDALAQIIAAQYRGKATLVNRGIGGNRVLHDACHVKAIPGEGSCFGKSAVNRFDQDAFSPSKPDVIIYLEGVNDLMHPYIFEKPEEIVTATQLEKAVSTFLHRAHDHGTRMYFGTIMPFRNDEMPWLEEAEKVRQEYNEWVRTQTIADGVIDFDYACRKQDKIEYLKDMLHIGDGLHPNTAGGEEMARLIPMNEIISESEGF